MAVRHHGNLVRHHFQHQVHKAGHGGVALNVEFRLQEGTDFPHVGIADVPFVGPGMHGNAFCAEAFAVEGGLGYVRHVPAARVAQGGHFIDVDTESCHVFLGLNCHKISEIYRNILILEVNLNHRNENSLFHSE